MINKDFLRLTPVGFVRRDYGQVFLDIKDEYIPGMKGIDGFSHIQVLWWPNKFNTEKCRKTLVCNPPYNAPETGVFACRSPVRPNPIALTTCKIKEIDFEKGLIFINNIDAHTDTPVIDIKGYFPVLGRVKEVKVPSWASDWSKWYPEEGHGLKE